MLEPEVEVRFATEHRCLETGRGPRPSAGWHCVWGTALCLPPCYHGDATRTLIGSALPPVHCRPPVTRSRGRSRDVIAGLPTPARSFRESTETTHWTSFKKTHQQDNPDNEDSRPFRSWRRLTRSMGCSGPCGRAFGVPTTLESRKDEAQVTWKPPWSGRLRYRACPGNWAKGDSAAQCWDRSVSATRIFSFLHAQDVAQDARPSSVRCTPRRPDSSQRPSEDPAGWERRVSRWQTPRRSTRKSSEHRGADPGIGESAIPNVNISPTGL